MNKQPRSKNVRTLGKLERSSSINQKIRNNINSEEHETGLSDESLNWQAPS